MKIAIVSLVLHTNYGGILQSYALQTVLERMGHEVEVLRKPAVKWPSKYKFPFCIAKRLVKRLIDGKTPVFYEKNKERQLAFVRKNTELFINKYIHVRYIDSFKDIKEGEYDAFVVGSDQVWRPRYFTKQWGATIDNAFLTFTKGWNIKRMAYAASFGVDECEYSEQELKDCSNALKLFDAITVRELSGIDLLQKYFGCTGEQVIDPTLLLTKDDYLSLIQNEPKSKGSLLVYVLDENDEIKELVKRVAKEKGLIPFYVKAPYNETQPKVETWLKGFADAEFVVTDSFHACVFSVIFEKPFVVVGNKDRGNARFDSLFSLLGTNENYVSSSDVYKSNSSFLLYKQSLNLCDKKTQSSQYLKF